MHEKYMQAALAQAQKAIQAEEVPVGAVLVNPAGDIVAQAHNRTRTDNDPTAHAEIVALRAGAKLAGTARLDGYALYVTLEPCAMCAGAIAEAHIAKLYYGAEDKKMGAVDNGAKLYANAYTTHKPKTFAGIEAQKASALLKAFFQSRR